jgi:hypothetical protein
LVFINFDWFLLFFISFYWFLLFFYWFLLIFIAFSYVLIDFYSFLMVFIGCYLFLLIVFSEDQRQSHMLAAWTVLLDALEPPTLFADLAEFKAASRRIRSEQKNKQLGQLQREAFTLQKRSAVIGFLSRPMNAGAASHEPTVTFAATNDAWLKIKKGVKDWASRCHGPTGQRFPQNSNDIVAEGPVFLGRCAGSVAVGYQELRQTDGLPSFGYIQALCPAKQVASARVHFAWPTGAEVLECIPPLRRAC